MYEILETPVRMTESTAMTKFPNWNIYIKYDVAYLRTLGDFDEPEGLVIAIEDFDTYHKHHEELYNLIQSMENDKCSIRQVHGANYCWERGVYL